MSFLIRIYGRARCLLLSTSLTQRLARLDEHPFLFFLHLQRCQYFHLCTVDVYQALLETHCQSLISRSRLLPFLFLLHRRTHFHQKPIDIPNISHPLSPTFCFGSLTTSAPASAALLNTSWISSPFSVTKLISAPAPRSSLRLMVDAFSPRDF